MFRCTYIACNFTIAIILIITISSAVNTDTIHTVVAVIIYITIAVIVLTIVYATF